MPFKEFRLQLICDLGKLQKLRVKWIASSLRRFQKIRNPCLGKCLPYSKHYWRVYREPSFAKNLTSVQMKANCPSLCLHGSLSVVPVLDLRGSSPKKRQKLSAPKLATVAVEIVHITVLSCREKQTSNGNYMGGCQKYNTAPNI